jgi:uncharacterized protein
MRDINQNVELFSADGLTFGIRVLDGAVAIARGESEESRASVVDRLASTRPERAIDLTQPSYEPNVAPKSITLMVAQHCNLRCTYCYGVAGEYGSPGLLEHVAAVEALRDFLMRPGPAERNVNFFGGEPLLAFLEIQRLVAHALRLAVTYDRAVSFTMTTNATLVTDVIACWLSQHGFSVVVSIDGDPDMHGRNRPDASGRSSWGAVTRGSRQLLQSLGPERVRARSTLTAGYPDIQGMVETLKGIGFTNIHLGAVEPTSSGAVGAWSRDDYDKFHKTTSEVVSPEHWIDGTKLAWDPLQDTLGLLATGRRRERACGVGNSAIAVSSDGHRYPCHRYVGDARFQLDAGGDRLGGAANGVTAYEEQRALALVECHSCYVKAFCAGSCAHVSLQRIDAGLSAHAPEECDFIRAQTKEAIRVFARLRVPPNEGRAELLGPDYLTRPMHTAQLREILARNIPVTDSHSRLDSGTSGQVREAFTQAMEPLRRRLPPEERDRASMQNPDGQDWLTLGLPYHLVVEGVLPRLDVTAARLTGRAAAIVAYLQGLSSLSSGAELVRLGWAAGYTEAVRSVANLSGGEPLDEALQRVLSEYVGAREAETRWICGSTVPENWSAVTEAKHYGLALPAILLARLYGLKHVETDIRCLAMFAGPVRQLLDDYADVVDDERNQKYNFWDTYWRGVLGSVRTSAWPRILGDGNAARLVERHIIAGCNRGSAHGSWLPGALNRYAAFLRPAVDQVRQRWASQLSESLPPVERVSALVQLKV